MKRNKICVGVIFVLFILILFILILAIFFNKKENVTYNVVFPALDKTIAKEMVKENECYIVRVADPEEFGTGGWWYYMDGEKKKIYLSGRNPANELSYIFLESDMNSFLVIGKMEDQKSKTDGCPILNVENWYLIAPIKRDYGPKQYRQEQRDFYPTDYLDTYDLEQGDYAPMDSQNR